MSSVSPYGTIAANYAQNYVYAEPPPPPDTRAVDTMYSAANLASTLTQPGGANAMGIASGVSDVAASLTQNPGLQRVATMVGGVNDAANALARGDTFGVGGAVTGAVARLTGNATIGRASQVLSGVSSTQSALRFGGAAAGGATGAGAALGLLGGIVKGPASKVLNAASVVASSVGNILSKATSVGSGVAGAIAGVAGALIGGKAGKIVSSVGSIATGALMLAANPIMGAVGILGGLFGLFGKKKRVSELSEQMLADFKGDGTKNDVMTRAPKGENNNLQIQVQDGATDQDLKTVQTIKIGGWFNHEHESRMAQTVDVTGDGKDDIVWRDKNSVSVFVNRGDGSFGSPEFAGAKKQARDDAGALRQYGLLLQSLDSVVPRNPGSKSFTSQLRSATPALRQAFDANGGEAKLGSFEKWAAEMVQHAGLYKLRAEFKAQPNHSDFGGFANFVAQRLSERGIARPEALTAAIENKGNEGELSLDEFLGNPGAMRATEHLSARQAADDMKTGGFLGTVARRVEEAPSERVVGATSDGAEESGAGVSLATQHLDVNVSDQKPEQLLFWDVNGDDFNDAVFYGEGVATPRAFLNQGNGVFESDPIDMAAPTEQDWDQLALADAGSGVRFMNADFRGDGQERMQAVRWMGQWMAVPTQPAQPAQQAA